MVYYLGGASSVAHTVQRETCPECIEKARRSAEVPEGRTTIGRATVSMPLSGWFRGWASSCRVPGRLFDPFPNSNEGSFNGVE